jgi:prepilin-type N-terminal cleavage/methylation domain-containing protein
MKIDLIISRRGFTLLELLIVIGITGILSLIVNSGFHTMATLAKIRIARSTLQSVSRFIQTRRLSGEKLTVLQMSGNVCADCPFRTGQVMTEVTAAMAQNDAAWVALGYSEKVAPRDPWGRPYSFNANELEWSANDCNWDMFESAGPDGIVWTDDDIAICIPHVICNDNPPPEPCPRI